MFLPSEALAWMGADIAKVENPKGGEALPAEAVIEDHDLIGSPLPLAYEPGARPALGQGVHLDRLGQVRTGLPAGGSRIRTIGPRVMYAFGIGSGRFTRASGKVGVNENDGTRRSRGTDGSNSVPSSRESATNCFCHRKPSAARRRQRSFAVRFRLGGMEPPGRRVMMPATRSS